MTTAAISKALVLFEIDISLIKGAKVLIINYGYARAFCLLIFCDSSVQQSKRKVKVVDNIYCCSDLFVQPGLQMVRDMSMRIYSSALAENRRLCHCCSFNRLYKSTKLKCLVAVCLSIRYLISTIRLDMLCCMSRRRSWLLFRPSNRFRVSVLALC